MNPDPLNPARGDRPQPGANSPGTSQGRLPSRRIDPILQEVYDLKARLNAEAGYSVEKILERARQTAARHASKSN